MRKQFQMQRTKGMKEAKKGSKARGSKKLAAICSLLVGPWGVELQGGCWG